VVAVSLKKKSQDLIRSERQWSEALSEGDLEELFAP
jgi:hypothetical protein